MRGCVREGAKHVRPGCQIVSDPPCVLILREAYMLRVTMLRLLILKFGAQLKEIQISPEHGEAYVKELRSYYFIQYGGQGVCEFFMWGGRITVRPVVRI